MRLDIKTVKGHDYVQLVDDNGYIHHIGPANEVNLGVALFILCRMEALGWREWFKDYYRSKGLDVESDEGEKVIAYFERMFLDGGSLLVAPDSVFSSMEGALDLYNGVIDRVAKFDVVHSHLMAWYEEHGIKVSKTRLRKYVQKNYRLASSGDKEDWIRYMINKIGL